MHYDNECGLKVLPRIGDLAPDFTAITTLGSLRFHEWKQNKWAILFSHPADFTPVCSTELIQFAKDKVFFDKRNTLLIGLSCGASLSNDS
jgi:alkyl hydroperoxide reductase subunit AhpC